MKGQDDYDWRVKKDVKGSICDLLKCTFWNLLVMPHKIKI